MTCRNGHLLLSRMSSVGSSTHMCRKKQRWGVLGEEADFSLDTRCGVLSALPSMKRWL